jgi:pimeloyl-ACP methyl ester carboxylesterase
MLELSGVFGHRPDRTRPRYRQLLAELGAAFGPTPPMPDPREMPPGNGHVVFVVPAFLVGDAFTWPLRRFLDRCGYATYGWELGINWGPTAALMEGLRRRFRALRASSDGPISVIGVSLGGLLARDLAYDFPDDIRQVITLASPFNLPTLSTLAPVVRLCAPFYTSEVDIARLAEPLPVPASSLYTIEDAVVAWESCFCTRDEAAIDVGGAHILICRNPTALGAVAQRLAAVP